MREILVRTMRVVMAASFVAGLWACMVLWGSTANGTAALFQSARPEPSESGKRRLSPADVREELQKPFAVSLSAAFVRGNFEANAVALDYFVCRDFHVDGRLYLRWAEVDRLDLADVVCRDEVWIDDSAIGSTGATIERVSGRFVRLESTGVDGSLMVRHVRNLELVECGIQTDLRLENIGGPELSLAGTAVGRNVKIFGLEVRELDVRGFSCEGDFDLDPGDRLEVIRCDPKDADRLAHALPRNSRVRLVYTGMGR